MFYQLIYSYVYTYGLQTIYFHSIRKTSPFSLETQFTSPAPNITSSHTPRPLYRWCASPAAVCGRCVCVCVYLFGRTTYFQLSPLTQRFSSRFQCSRERRLQWLNAGSCHGLYSFMTFFSEDFFSSLSELS